MPLIELPRALEDYFAFAETEPTRNGRRFSITLPYMDGDRMDRLQWWYHVTPAQEQMYEGNGLAFFRARAIERFGKHVERWLEITAQRFHGDEPIPRLGSQHQAVTNGLRPPSGAHPPVSPGIPSGLRSPSGAHPPVDRLAAIRMDLDAIDKVANG